MDKPSLFDGDGLEQRYREIQSVYLSDQRPWVIGYSGGKDSTCTLQMVWVAISRLPAGSDDAAMNSRTCWREGIPGAILLLAMGLMCALRRCDTTMPRHLQARTSKASPP